LVRCTKKNLATLQQRCVLADFGGSAFRNWFRFFDRKKTPSDPVSKGRKSSKISCEGSVPRKHFTLVHIAWCDVKWLAKYVLGKWRIMKCRWKYRYTLIKM
jgi:hypothetical protein